MKEVRLSPIVGQLNPRQFCEGCRYNKSFGFWTKNKRFYCRNCYRKLSKKYSFTFVTTFDKYEKPTGLSPIDSAVCDVIQEVLNSVFPIPLDFIKQVKTLVKKRYLYPIPSNYSYVGLFNYLVTNFKWKIPTVEQRREMNLLWVQLWIETHQETQINQLIEDYGMIQNCSVESARKAIKMLIAEADPFGVYYRELLAEKQNTVQLTLL